MAKKKKGVSVKSGSKMIKRKVVRPTSMPLTRSLEKEIDSKKTDSFYPTAYMLNIVASVIVIVASVLFVVYPEQFGGFSTPSLMNLVSLLGVLDIVLGLAMLFSSAFMRINLREASVFVLVFSTLALLFTPHGFVIGPLIGMVVSIVVLAKIR